MDRAYLAFVLHAHLPYIRHPEHEEFLEEDWFFEAVTETYVPLIHMWERLEADGTPFAMTVSLTPPLLEMMADPLLQGRCIRYLERRCDLAERETSRTRSRHPEHHTARMYQRRFQEVRRTYCDRYKRDLVSAFRHFQDRGNVQVLTCAATHGMLPLMVTPNAIRAQVATAVRAHRRHLGRDPKGIWLPECAYRAGLDELLVDYGITHFLVDAHGILNGHPTPRCGVHAPVRCPSGAAVFGRDLESSKQVWSADEGYPGASDYREFYRDLGYDGDYEHIRPYLHPDGVRRNLGIKYHRVTGKVALHEKQLYDVERARRLAREHASNFLWCRQHQLNWLKAHLPCHPIVVAPYDAELFGHWWYEGPDFIEDFFRHAQYCRNDFEATTLEGYLERHPAEAESTPSSSSWGNKGYFEVWLNGSNDWIYPHLHHAERRMAGLAAAKREASGPVRDALNQAGRELLLAQSSDWAFIINGGTTVAYATRRTREHIHRFNVLCDQVETGQVNPETAAAYCRLNPIFPDVDFRDWA